jgi:hypothetical protein
VKSPLLLESLIIVGFDARDKKNQSLSLTPAGKCIAKAIEATGINLADQENEYLIAQLKIQKEIIRSTVATSIIKHFPGTPVYYSEEPARKEEFVKEQVAIDKIRRANTNKRARAEQYLKQDKKTVTPVNFKMSADELTKIQRSFVYNKKIKKLDLPNWKNNNEPALKSANIEVPSSGKFKVLGRNRGVWVEGKSLTIGKCPHCATQLILRKDDSVTSEHLDYYIAKCDRLVRESDESCEYHHMFEFYPDHIQELNDSGVVY